MVTWRPYSDYKQCKVWLVAMVTCALLVVTVWSSSNHSHQAHFALLIVTVWSSSNHSHQVHFLLEDHTVTISNAKYAWWLWLLEDHTVTISNAKCAWWLWLLEDHTVTISSDPTHFALFVVPVWFSSNHSHQAKTIQGLQAMQSVLGRYGYLKTIQWL
jgi:hypothetical protein